MSHYHYYHWGPPLFNNSRTYSQRESYDPSELYRHVKAFNNGTSSGSGSAASVISSLGRSSSRTSTRTLTEAPTAMNAQLTGGRSVTRTSYNLPSQRSTRCLTDISAPNDYKYVIPQAVQGSHGLQVVVLLGDNQGTGGTNVQVPFYGVKDLSDIWTVIGSGSIKGSQFTVPTGKREFIIQSRSNSNQIFWLYDIVPRFSIDSTDTSIQDPITAWTQGYLVEDNNGGSAGTLFSTPFDSKLFCENFKVIRVHKVIQAPGDLHRHIVHTRQHKWLSDNVFYNVGQPPTLAGSTRVAIGHRTIYTMLVLMGQPAHTTDATPVVTTASSGVDIICHTHYTYKWAQDVQRSMKQFSNVSTSSTVARIQQEASAAQSAGAVATDTNA